MGDNINNPIVLGSLRYKSAPNVDFLINVPFLQNVKNFTEYDRSSNISLLQIFEEERQRSNLFRPTSKLSFIFYNSYTGYSSYDKFAGSLYYLNALEASQDSCIGNDLTYSNWIGLPQYSEFNFVRDDYNQSGYTIDPSPHIKFVPKSASNYNWSFYITYAFENEYNQNLSAKILVPGISTPTQLNWVVSEGVPFVIKLSQINGLNVIQFWCPIKHGLNSGEFLKFTTSFASNYFNNNELLQIYSFGNLTVGSDEYVVNVINTGFISLSDGITGTFKRVILDLNLDETTSEYYIRKHKVLTNVKDYVMNKCAYEQNIFKNVTKYELESTTPNNVGRISIKEGGQSYLLSFNNDIDTSNLVDNQIRPISKLYYTIIWRGYFGWTKSIKQGWDFNLQLDPTNQQPTNWWSNSNSDSDTNITTSNYTKGGYTFIYNNNLNKGDVLLGSLCEWNDYYQLENELSDYYHKIRFNENVFNTEQNNENNPFGYFYKPHFDVKIAEFSDYIEEGDPRTVIDIPNYAYFSKNRNVFIWRDFYPYGFIDANGIGVDLPYLNNKHHPNKNIIFRLIPEGTNYNDFNYGGTVINIFRDGCE